MSEQNNPFRIAQQQFDTAADILGLHENIRAVLRVPHGCEGSATIRQYCAPVAPSTAAASRHSRFNPSSAGVMIRIISGIWKNR